MRDMIFSDQPNLPSRDERADFKLLKGASLTLRSMPCAHLPFPAQKLESGKRSYRSTNKGGLLFSNHSYIKEDDSMKLSARNILKGKVKNITEGSVNDEVVVELLGGQEVVAVVTKTSVQNLGLSKGQDVFAVIKASSVMLAVE